MKTQSSLKKLLLAVSSLLLAGSLYAFDVYTSSSPTPAATSGTLCGSGTIAYLYSVCESSPVAGNFTTVFSSAGITNAPSNTGSISGGSFGCIVYQANLGTIGMSYSKTTASQFTYNYLCN